MMGSKSAALLIGTNNTHHLLWGDTVIRIANSTNLTHWPDIGTVLLAPRPDRHCLTQPHTTAHVMSCSFDTTLVESGPNPMLLSTGDYLFVYNSANASYAYIGAAGELS